MLGVRADRELAAKSQRSDGRCESPKLDYYRTLAGAPLLPSAATEVRLQRREKRAAHLEVVHDRIDATSGCFVRHTFHLSQRRGSHVVFRDEDVPVPSARFLRLMERHAGADAELALLLISDLPGVAVNEVVRGAIGPLHFRGFPSPPLLTPVLEESPSAFILHLAFERAGVEVGEDRCRDPFSRIYREALGPAAREPVEARRAALGYRVAKDRRLICTPAAEGPLREALARAGANLVVRSS
jgi:hypothetical protein